MENISASAAKANVADVTSNSGVFMAPLSSGQASSDGRIHAFANYPQTMPADSCLHAHTRQLHISPADIRGHTVATPQSLSLGEVRSQALAVQHQPLCPVLPPGQVMTDEQLETLRRQISVYATICQQLVEMHKAIMAQQGSASGLWLSPSIPLDSSLHSLGHKLTSRQRWTPSQTQLHILEKLFEQESGTPNKQRIKEITVELSQHGQISETNVYNWFQNRRARTKRKQQFGGATNGDSELDMEVEFPEEKKGKIDGDFKHHTSDTLQTTDRAFPGGDSREHLQGLPSLTQEQIKAHSQERSLNRGPPSGLHDGSHMVGRKMWELPFTLPESRPEFATFSASQDFQGRQMVITGANNCN